MYSVNIKLETYNFHFLPWKQVVVLGTPKLPSWWIGVNCLATDPCCLWLHGQVSLRPTITKKAEPH